MASREERRQKLLEMGLVQKKPQVPGTKDLSRLRPVRRQVRAAVSKQAQNARAVFDESMKGISALSPGLESMMRREKSQLHLLHKISTGLRKEDIFEGCKVQYGYDPKQNVYSISANLYGRPRIITVRVGENFMEISLANSKGRLLEIIRQEDDRGVTFNKLSK